MTVEITHISAFYYMCDPRQQWIMMPDLASIKNSESRMDKFW